MKNFLKHPCKKCISKPCCLNTCEDYDDLYDILGSDLFGKFCLGLSILIVGLPVLLMSIFVTPWCLFSIVIIWAISFLFIKLFVAKDKRNDFDYTLYILAPFFILVIFVILNSFEKYMIKHLPYEIKRYETTIAKDFLEMLG